jgi:hypothetical protein
LAWAANHHVEAPAFVVARAIATRLRHDVHLETPAKCCEHESASRTKSDDCGGVSSRSAPRPESLVNASLWGRCRGFELARSVISDVAPPPEAVGWQFERTLVGQVCQAPIRSSASKAPPPLPPPRCATL